jgi:hypothetical protein
VDGGRGTLDDDDAGVAVPDGPTTGSNVGAPSDDDSAPPLDAANRGCSAAGPCAPAGARWALIAAFASVAALRARRRRAEGHRAA